LVYPLYIAKEDFTMKKLLVVLLALMCVGAMFAQATVNGYVRVTGTFDKDMNYTYADRLRLNLSYTSEDKNFSMFTRLQGGSTTAPSAVYMNGSAKLLDGMLKVTAGYMSTYDYSIGSGVSEYKLGSVYNNYDLDSSKAALFQLYPMEGLDIGLVLYDNAGAAFGAGNLGVNLAYTLKDLGKIVVSSKLATDTAKSSVTATFQYTGMEGMDVAVGYKGLASTQIWALANYAAGDLSVQVAPEYYLTASELYVEGDVTYKMAPLSFNVLFAYDTTKAILGDDYMAGLEAIYSVGKFKGLTGFYYYAAAATGLKIPLELRFSF